MNKIMHYRSFVLFSLPTCMYGVLMYFLCHIFIIQSEIFDSLPGLVKFSTLFVELNKAA